MYAASELCRLVERANRARWLSGTLAMAVVIALSACAHSPSQAFVDPAWRAQQYDSFLAYGAFRDLSVEGRFEKALCKRLSAAGPACMTMLAVAPPTRPQDAASRQRAAVTSGAKAILIVEMADTDTSSRRRLANGEPAYRVSLVDVKSQRVVARFAIEGRGGLVSLDARAKRLARETVTAMRSTHLLYRR